MLYGLAILALACLVIELVANLFVQPVLLSSNQLPQPVQDVEIIVCFLQRWSMPRCLSSIHITDLYPPFSVIPGLLGFIAGVHIGPSCHLDHDLDQVSPLPFLDFSFVFNRLNQTFFFLRNAGQNHCTISPWHQ